MGKKNFIECLSKTDIEQILQNCGYRLLTMEESEKIGARPYRKHLGIITCYCVVSPDDMRDYLQRQYRSNKKESKFIDKLKSIEMEMSLITAILGLVKFGSVSENDNRILKKLDSSYVRKVVFEDYFVKEIKKKNNKQNLFEKMINEEFENYMNDRFTSYSKQREEYYNQLFGEDLEDTL